MNITHRQWGMVSVSDILPWSLIYSESEVSLIFCLLSRSFSLISDFASTFAGVI